MLMSSAGSPAAGLMKLINDYAPKAVKEQEIDNYFARKVAIDASMSLYQFLVTRHKQTHAADSSKQTEAENARKRMTVRERQPSEEHRISPGCSLCALGRALSTRPFPRWCTVVPFAISPSLLFLDPTHPLCSPPPLPSPPTRRFKFAPDLRARYSQTRPAKSRRICRECSTAPFACWTTVSSPSLCSMASRRNSRRESWRSERRRETKPRRERRRLRKLVRQQPSEARCCALIIAIFLRLLLLRILTPVFLALVALPAMCSLTVRSFSLVLPCAENQEDINKYKKQLVKVTKEHNEETRHLLRLMGVPIVEAPSEAEAQVS